MIRCTADYYSVRAGFQAKRNPAICRAVQYAINDFNRQAALLMKPEDIKSFRLLR